ncbi:MAG: Maf family protein [Anaerolineae bacterium]
MVSLILASSSPRRQELLRRLGVPFEVTTADLDESQQPGEAPLALVQRLARAKALAVAARRPGCAVLGADTIVVLDDLVLGKPANAAEATAMLRSLRDRTHWVWSAVYARNPQNGREAAALNGSQVWMRSYSDAEIAAYVDSGDPLDKAGAYAIQHRQFAPVARIIGCYSSVMGFPLNDIARLLCEIGLNVPGDVAATCASPFGCCHDLAP